MTLQEIEKLEAKDIETLKSQIVIYQKIGMNPDKLQEIVDSRFNFLNHQRSMFGFNSKNFNEEVTL
jgi:hypothetical protein